jgi:nicotinate-nucleotide pyrophosphorylase
LRLVHEGQAQIYQILQTMEQKLNAIQQQSGVAPQTGGGQQAPVAGGGNSNRFKLAHLF